MFEFQRRDWTFHGKGIWVTFPGEILPQLTVIGSSNFGACRLTDNHQLLCYDDEVQLGSQGFSKAVVGLGLEKLI